jgi:hypothetical protein
MVQFLSSRGAFSYNFVRGVANPRVVSVSETHGPPKNPRKFAASGVSESRKPHGIIPAESLTR